MPGPKPAPCNFSEDFLQDARQTVRRRTVAMQDVQRCRLVLLLYEQPDTSSAKAGEMIGLSCRQVQRWRSRWAGGDFSIEDFEGRGRKASFPPSRPGSGESHRL